MVATDTMAKMRGSQLAPARAPPLDGLRVLDLTRVLAGPWCTMTLADLGADVIKIENPRGGDDTRHWGPPYAGGEAAYYLCTNRSKRSVALDLTSADGQRICRALAAKSDIIVENFRVGALVKFGLDHETLRSTDPGLIYCSISGYGHDSPLASRAGYDYVIQAEGGLMSVTGYEDGDPVKVGVAVADLFTGMAAVQAILAALACRARDRIGQHIDMALYDCQLAMLANVASAFLADGAAPKRYGNGHPSVVPYQTFRTLDGRVVIAIGNDRQFRAFCLILGKPELATDTRFSTNPRRVETRDALLSILIPLIAQRTTAHWLDALRAADVPAGEVRSVGQALTAVETLARSMVCTIPHPKAGSISMVSSPLRLSGTPVRDPIAPPLLGQHTDEVLSGLLHYGSEEITRLRHIGAIG
jgi:crotonobetainyl-CoA:carnitine CoA-transferase CaiB-like acyl-CoA transferase